MERILPERLAVLIARRYDLSWSRTGITRCVLQLRYYSFFTASHTRSALPYHGSSLSLKIPLIKRPYLIGSLNVGDMGIRLVGLLWLVGAIAFIATGIGTLAAHPLWLSLLLYSTIYSFVLSVLGWPEARIGVWINITILSLLLASKAGWLTRFEFTV